MKLTGNAIAILIIFGVLYYTFWVIGGVVAASGHHNLQFYGQFGDFFGALNPLIGILTIWLAYKNISAIGVQIKEQQDQFQNQKTHEHENLKREKLEKLCLLIKRYLETLADTSPGSESELTPANSKKMLVRIFAVMSEIELLCFMYFPGLIDKYIEIDKSYASMKSCFKQYLDNKKTWDDDEISKLSNNLTELTKGFYTYIIANEAILIRVKSGN